MNPMDTTRIGKNLMDDIDRMTNEGLAGGWEGELDRNGLINTSAMEEEAPPTLNGKPVDGEQ
jgi:hypothetical protein